LFNKYYIETEAKLLAVNVASPVFINNL